MDPFCYLCFMCVFFILFCRQILKHPVASIMCSCPTYQISFYNFIQGGDKGVCCCFFVLFFRFVFSFYFSPQLKSGSNVYFIENFNFPRFEGWQCFPDQPAHMRSLIRAFASHLNSMTVKLLTE